MRNVCSDLPSYCPMEREELHYLANKITPHGQKEGLYLDNRRLGWLQESKLSVTAKTCSKWVYIFILSQSKLLTSHKLWILMTGLRFLQLFVLKIPRKVFNEKDSVLKHQD